MSIQVAADIAGCLLGISAPARGPRHDRKAFAECGWEDLLFDTSVIAQSIGNAQRRGGTSVASCPRPRRRRPCASSCASCPGSARRCWRVDGVVEPDLAKWDTDDCGYADVPVTAPLTELQIAKQFSTLNLSLGDARPHVRGKIREYVTL